LEAGVLILERRHVSKMLTLVNGATQAGEWFANVLTTGSTSSTGSNTFEQQLLNVISESLERAAEDPGKIEAAPNQVVPQNETIESGKSQNPVSCSRAADTSTSPPAVAATATSEEEPNANEPAALTALRAALVAAGHDPDRFRLSYEEQEVYFPGGNYINRGITATFDNGYQETYGADLTAASPNGTVLSIEHTLRDIAAGTYS
jgi:hypothetical protein